MGQHSDMPENGQKKEKAKRKRVIKYTVFIFVAVLIVLTTSIFHIFGPYKGKVVDLETGAPIEGAAVLIVFSTESFYAVSSYADAVETLTDKNGEFKIPWHLAITFHPLSVWESNGRITVFKPGYGAYPGHNDSGPLFVPNGTIPKKEFVTIKLPNLEKREERRLNLGGVRPSGDVPDRIAINLLRLISEERANIGLKP